MIILPLLWMVTITATATDNGVNFVAAAAAPTPTPLECSATPEGTIHHVLNEVVTWQRCHQQRQQEQQLPSARPFVTATFAQSIDGYMSPFRKIDDDNENSNCTTSATEQHIPTQSNYPLSSHESLVLTHGLRSIHDGILIGGRTLLLDNPRLTNRLWGIATTKINYRYNTRNNYYSNKGIHNNMATTGSAVRVTTSTTAIASSNNNNTKNDNKICLPSQNHHDDLRDHQPQPIILDPNLRYITQLLRETNGTMNVCHPIVCCSFDAASSNQLHLYQYFHHHDPHDHCFRSSITNNTIRLVPCHSSKKNDNNNNDRKCDDYMPIVLNMTDVLHQLYHQFHIHSIMVEGGPSTLSTLFATKNVLTDAIIITIAPQLLGNGIRPILSSSVCHGSTSTGSNVSEKRSNHIDTFCFVPLSATFVTLGNDAIFVARCDQRRD